MLSSRLMGETGLIADHPVIIGRGRLLADTTVDDFVRQADGGGVKVATAEARKLRWTSTRTRACGVGASGVLLKDARPEGSWRASTRSRPATPSSRRA
jgi:hypothetical protein